MDNTRTKRVRLVRRKKRVRKRVYGTPECPRLSVRRSLKHIYAQIVDDQAGRTLASASTLDKQLRGQTGYAGNKGAAAALGAVIAQRAIEAGIKEVVFDRREYKYHGRVAALADGSSAGTITVKLGKEAASATSSIAIWLGPSAPMLMPLCEPISFTFAAGNATPIRI